MAAIIHGADLPHQEGAPAESAGVLAVFDGIRDIAPSDEERLRLGSSICEAIHAFCMGAV
jgi:hypothetical protein